MSEAESFDVAIFGGGPSGASTAIFLAQSGFSVSIVTLKAREGKRIGESLPPQSSIVLKQLGLWEVFLKDGHLPCHGNKSVWGGSELAHQDFIRNPYGHGWHIDRTMFERRLLERVRASGGRIIQRDLPPRLSYRRGSWTLNFESPAESIRTRFLVDATGRARWLARSQGARFVFEDRQVALIAFLRPTHCRLDDSTSLVEATKDGWWYSAAIPDGGLAAAFMTDPDLHILKEIVSRTGWMKLMSDAPETAARILRHNYELAMEPCVIPANSGRLDRVCGEAWLAVGDAAISLDPLAAHGLTIAMTSGRDAAEVIRRQLGGDRSGLTAYAALMVGVYEYYRSMRWQYYFIEHRWPEAQYWVRRRDWALQPLERSMS
jgi:2-polyprenyl-6-methoxyphenol hydroxylase-like FAD-dependent oxidoreductase